MSVYFVQCNQYIKIGYSNNPCRRIASLQTGNPYNIETLLIIPGDKEIERELQRQMIDSRHRGEWFSANEQMSKIVEQLSSVFTEYSNFVIETYQDSGLGPEYASDDIDGDGSISDDEDNLQVYCPGGTKANRIRAELADNPLRSDTEIARIIGCSRMHVWSIRNNRGTGSPL